MIYSIKHRIECTQDTLASAGAHCDLGLPKAIKQDVGGLQVVVDDVAGRFVQVGQALHDLRGNGLSLLFRQHLLSTGHCFTSAGVVLSGQRCAAGCKLAAIPSTQGRSRLAIYFFLGLRHPAMICSRNDACRCITALWRVTMRQPTQLSMLLSNQGRWP